MLRAVNEATSAPGSFAIIGAVARNAWAPPRATTDLDLTILADNALLQRLEEGFSELGYRLVRTQKTDPSDELPDIEMFRSDEAEPRQIDLLVSKTEFEREVLKRAPSVEVGSIEAPVASPEDLIVYKLLAHPPRDQEGIRAVVRTQRRAARALDWNYVERWSHFWQIEERFQYLRQELGE